jgi:hypothetical protein
MTALDKHGRLKKALFRYFGSKRRGAKYHYPGPKCDTICEPFAGSAAYSLTHHERQVVLVEANPRIAGLWKWLVTAPSETIAALPLFQDCAPGYNLVDWARESGQPWQAAELVMRWQRVGVGSNNTPTISSCNSDAWAAGNRKSRDSRWCSATRDYVAEAVQHIRHWTVLEGDYSLAQPCPRATLFCDPPYQHNSATYQCERFTRYAELAAYCRAGWGQAIVCEAEPADWLPFRLSHTVRSGPRRENTLSKELIWTGDTA